MVSSSRRAVVTGLGVVSPLGLDTASFWEALRSGRSGIRTIQSFDAGGLPVRIAGEIMDFDADPFLPTEHKKSLKVMGRASRFALGAAGLALRDSGMDLNAENPERLYINVATISRQHAGKGPLPTDPISRTKAFDAVAGLCRHLQAR